MFVFYFAAAAVASNWNGPRSSSHFMAIMEKYFVRFFYAPFPLPPILFQLLLDISINLLWGFFYGPLEFRASGGAIRNDDVMNK